MKNFFYFLCLSAFILSSSTANALVKEKSNTINQAVYIEATSFTDYPPFGQQNSDALYIKTIFTPFLDMLGENGKHSIMVKGGETYKTLVFKVVEGEINVLLGAYYDTRMYDGLELLYPSIVNNPIVAVTLTDGDFNITSKKDLKNLRGAIDSREYVSDYVQKEMQKLNVKKYDDSYKLYEQLFVGNIDYILTSRYYGAIEQAKMGIRNMVNMPKTAIWDMPLFIAVSNINKNSEKTRNTIKAILKKEGGNLEKQINQLIKDIIRKTDEMYQGVVPPSFVK